MSTTTPPPPPAPNSVWYQPAIRRVMRATPLSDGTVIAHDAELADRMLPGVNPVSWRGTVDEFNAAFRPVDPGSFNFPKLASIP